MDPFALEDNLVVNFSEDADHPSHSLKLTHFHDTLLCMTLRIFKLNWP